MQRSISSRVGSWEKVTAPYIGVASASVRTPAPLTATQESRLAETLSRIYGRPMDLRVDVDADVLGGLVIRVNDEVIDGSVAHRLDEARHRLAD